MSRRGINQLDIFVNRLKKLGIDVKLGANLPWIYIDYINGKRVTEKFRGNHGFTVAFLKIRPGEQGVNFTDIREIFKLIRKYCENETIRSTKKLKD